jgi:acetyl esterase/lipase
MRLALLLTLAAALRAGQPLTITLYPDRTFTGEEKIEERGKNGVTDRSISQAVRPDLTVYFPAREKASGVAIVIAPGGGYTHLAIDKEGHDIARWLASRGIAGIVLKYRLPFADGAKPDNWHAARGEAESSRRVSAVAIEDGQQAMRTVRSHATDWNLRPDAIGMMGFSAGGLLAALMGGETDAALRPNFLGLIYPAVPRAVPMPASMPVFIAQADDDTAVRPESLLGYYAALKQARIPVELHIYNSGGHGFGMKQNGKTSASWPLQFEDWLKERGFAKQ